MVVSRTGEEAMAFPLTPVACRCNSSVTTGNVQMTHSYLQLERSQISCLDKVLLHKQRWGDRDALTRSLKLRKVCTNTSMFVRAALAPGVENTGKQAPNRLHQFLKVSFECTLLSHLHPIWNSRNLGSFLQSIERTLYSYVSLRSRSHHILQFHSRFFKGFINNLLLI